MLNRFLCYRISHAALVFAILLSPLPSPAVPTVNGIAVAENGSARHWNSLPVRICYSPSITTQFKKEFEAAVSAWNRAIGAKVFETGCHSKTADYQLENLDEHSLFFVTRGFGKSGDSLALARTLSSYNNKTGEMFDADILLNGEAFDWKKLKVDLRSVLIHELGHVLGLQHLYISTRSVMNQYPYQTGIVRRELGAYEMLAVKRAYFGGKEAPPAYLDAYFSGNLEKAVQLLGSSSLPEGQRAYALGIMQSGLKNLDSAISAFRDCLKIEPWNILAHYHLGDALNQKGDVKGAASAFEAVLKQNPDFYEASADLGLIRYQEKKLLEARRLFEKTLQINPVHYPACHFLKLITGNKKYDECLARFAP